MKRRTISGALFAGVLAAIAPASAMAQQVTIKMWMHEHPPRLPIDKQIIADFEKANPNIHIDYTVIAATEYATKLITAFASGSGPDLFNQFSGLVAQYYNSRILAPIDYAATGYGDEKGFSGHFFGGLDGIRFAGKYYGIPTEVSNYACYTNNKLWSEAGLDPNKDFPKTWEAFPAVAEKLTKRDANGNPIRRGFDFDWPNKNFVWMGVSTMMHQQGATLVDEETYTTHLDTAEGKRVMQYWVDWANKYKLGGPQYTDTRTDFLAGNLATDCSFGVWGLPQMKDAKIDYTVKPLPRWGEGNKSDEGFDAYAYYMMVNARSPAPVQAAAWKFARFFSDHAAELYTGAGLFVPRQEDIDTPQFKSDPSAQVFLEELKKAKFSPRIVGYDQVTDAFTRARDRMVQGGEPVAKVLPEINDQMNSMLKREKARLDAMAK
jgi:multiple sugar transport system substrate-binding protein